MNEFEDNISQKSLKQTGQTKGLCVSQLNKQLEAYELSNMSKHNKQCKIKSVWKINQTIETEGVFKEDR